MKKMLALAALVLACQAVAWAQPSLIFPSASVNTGETVCIEVKVKDFTDILAMDFYLRWDPKIIQFERVEGFGLPNLTAANFNSTEADSGRLRVAWLISSCLPNAVGVTTPDGTTIFKLCFKALGNYGEASEVILDASRNIDVKRVNACPNNIGMFSKNGIVSVGVRALTLYASQETVAKTGDLACVDFKVNGFDDLTYMQFTVQWNPSLLEFVNVQELDNLVNLAPSNFGTPDQVNVGAGKLTVSWNFVNPSDPGVTLPDSTTVFQACFRAIAPCETSAELKFIDSPTPLEFGNSVVEGFKVRSLTESGAVTVGDCDPVGLKLFADCGPPANPNSEVCVKITTSGFQQIREFGYNLEWNENILQFVGVRNLAPLPGFDSTDFNRANVSNGVLGVNWSTANQLGSNLFNGGAGTLYEVCFKVIGVEGGSPVNFTGPSKVVTFSNPNLGINPSNCAVEVNKPQGVVMNLKDVQAPLGDTACVDVSVRNFTNINSYQFSLAWESNHMKFVEVKNINLPEASQSSSFGFLGVDGGSLTFDWMPSKEYTVADNTVIFKACFEMTGDPQDCDDLQVVDNPIEAEAISTTSNGNNIGVVSQPAEACILFPEGFYVSIDSVSGDTGSVACVKFKVASFDNITSAKFPVSWEPSALEFVAVQNQNLTGLTNASFDVSSTGVGVLNVNWSNASLVNVADSTVIFEVCYNLVGSPGDCYEVRIGEPDPVVTTANGGGSLLSDPGEVCIRGRLNLQDTIIKSVSCPDAQDGEVTLVVTGGRGPLGYTWETIPQRFGPTARNLPAGKVVVTVFDNSSPALILRDTFDVPLNAELPTANAGADKDFTCNPPLVQLQGQGSQGANYKYRWRTVDGQLSSNDTTLNAAALAPGSYFLEVTNSETGCTARDTVNVLAVNFPTADAGQNRDFSCTSDTLRLGGAGSTTGAGVRYRWTSTLPSGTFVPGTDTLQNAIVTAPGTYTLAVTNTATGCVDRDSVVIENRQVLPDANAGSDAELPCGAAANVELISRSNNPEAVNVQWLNLNGQILSDSIRFFATAVGDYLLKITNPINNCSKIDTVRVLPSSKSPTVALDSAQLITCLQDTLILNTTVGNTGGFTFQWAAKSGGQFITGTQTTLSPQVARAGIYEITVRDTATSCVTVDSIVIREDKAAPTAEAGRADTITCRVGEVTLNGTGSATGADFTSQWTLNNTVVAADTLRPKVTVPGTYFINVTSKINGCVGRDSVKVDSNLTAPQVRVPIQLPQLTCKDSIITINATANPANPNFTIRWITADSTGIVSGQNTANLRVRTPGIYEIQVTNPANGCVGTNEAVVERDSIKSVSNAGADQKITCTTKTVTLNGNNSSVGSDITYLWRNVSGGQAPSPNNAPQVTVSTPGIYTLLVTNTRNSCTALDSVAVSKNDSLPQLRIARMDSLAITCRDSVARLDASATQPSTVNVQWNGLTGGVPRITPDPLIFEVTQGGNYEVIITRPDNGCVAKDTITVATRDSIPQIRLDSVATLTCTQNTATFDARNTRINGAFSTEWKALSGGSVQTSPNSPLQATATGAGKYQLTVTVTQSGCVATKAIDLKSPEFPIATATTTKPAIGCGENTTLNSAGSTSGAGINYRWAVVSGTGTIANPTAQTVQVDKAGNYQLIVTNSQNGCSDTAVVNITFNVQFALANAGKDTSVCAPNASLTANLPMGTTGTWRSLSNINIGTPTQPTISLSNLTTGSNRFVWALSAPGCGEYSADTVSVKVETAPTATDDAFTLKPGETQGTIVVTSNDNVANIGAFSVAIVENPLRGGISGVGADGKVGYVIKAGLFGEDAFKYKLCSTTCPSFCDSAAVSVTIEEDPNFVAPPTINAITPNGDGLNEQLVFEELLINAAQYPDNELIIFNRWGDIVHTARPYANNWDGTNNTGQPLPEGTYYYILRLNISEGIIIRGDVTIVR